MGMTLRRNEDFIQKCIEIHSDKYDYSYVNYAGLNSDIIIVCRTHGIFKQKAYLHLRKRGCKKCNNEVNSSKRRLTKEDFIRRANMVHNNKYCYSLVEYKNSRSKVVIICKKHGEFIQNSNSHLLGTGCPSCRSSKGEVMIMDILDKYSLKYEREYKFGGCLFVKQLSFDFFIPALNMCIEYDGVQHFKSVDFFGGDSHFEYVKNLDKIKDDFCWNMGIFLLRIKYTDNDIESIIGGILKKQIC